MTRRLFDVGLAAMECCGRPKASPAAATPTVPDAQSCQNTTVSRNIPVKDQLTWREHMVLGGRIVKQGGSKFGMVEKVTRVGGKKVTEGTVSITGGGPRPEIQCSACLLHWNCFERKQVPQHRRRIRKWDV